jgi:UDP-glucose 4-epimerase
MLKKILITGGAGYIGSIVAEKLKEYKIVIIDNLSTGKKFFLNKKWKFYKIDLCNKEKVSDVFRKENFDAVIHFAASISVEESQKNPKKYLQNNYINTKNLINLSKKHNVKKFIFASTASVYDSSKKNISESFKKYPLNNYGKTKLNCEEYLKKNLNLKSFQYIILRFFNVAGSNNNYTRGPIPDLSKHLIRNICVNYIKNNYKILIYGNNYKTSDGTCIRDFIHVNDLADICKLSLNKLFISKNIKTIINCGYGYGYSVLEVAKAFEKIVRKKIKIIFKNKRIGDPASVVCSNYKLKRFLNWRPRYNDLNFILRNSLKWFQRYYNK